MSLLGAELSSPYAERVDRDLKSATCGASITLKAKNIEVSDVAGYKVYKTRSGVSFTTNSAELTPLITKLILKMK